MVTMNLADQLRLVNEKVQLKRACEASPSNELVAMIYKQQASDMMSRLSGQANRQAKKGKNKLLVKKIKIHDGYGGRYLALSKGELPRNLTVDQLRCKYFYLWKECEAAGLSVEVIWNHNGLTDWYEFWVKW